MHLTIENSTQIILQIYFWLLNLWIDKSWNGGGRPSDISYSRYELISRWVLKILFWVTPADIQKYSIYMHSMNNKKIEDYMQNKDLLLENNEHDDILISNFCTNDKVTDFFTQTNNQKIAWAFIALIRKIDELKIDDELKRFMKKQTDNMLLHTDYKKGILKSIRDGHIYEIKLSLGENVQQLDLENLEKTALFLSINNKQYIWFKQKNIIIHNNNTISTYNFFKDILFSWGKLTYSDLIDGCYSSLRDALAKKLRTSN